VLPASPDEVTEILLERFPDVTRIDASRLLELTGGLDDDGPAIEDYAAVLIDENGKINLIEDPQTMSDDDPDA
jgi:hypothetical protein